MVKSTKSNNPNYYEAIIQLRPYDDAVFEFIQKDIANKKAEGIFISKVEELKTGIDIYMSSQKFTRCLGDRLKKQFRGWKLTITRKIFTCNRLTSRTVYRATVLFRKDKDVPEDKE